MMAKWAHFMNESFSTNLAAHDLPHPHDYNGHPYHNRRRLVSFKEGVRVRLHLHTADMTQQEMENTWYTNEELQLQESDQQLKAQRNPHMLVLDSPPSSASSSPRASSPPLSPNSSVRNAQRRLSDLRDLLEKESDDGDDNSIQLDGTPTFSASKTKAQRAIESVNEAMLQALPMSSSIPQKRRFNKRNKYLQPRRVSKQ